MVGSPKVRAVVLSLALTAGLTGCSSGHGTPGPGPGEGSQARSSSTAKGRADFSQRDMVVTARCSTGDSGGTVVTVDGWNPQSLTKKAHAEFRLPDTVLTKVDGVRPGTALEDLCAPTNLTDNDDILAVRSLFDRDFTKLAVVIQDPESKATHVGYVDRSGKLTDLTGQEDFGTTPHEDNAAMAPDGSAVWFTKEVDDKNYVARRALAGDHKVADQQSVEFVGERHVFVVGTPDTAVLGNSARLSPDGRRLLTEGGLLDLSDHRRFIGPDAIEQAPPLYCDKKTRSGGAIGWIDNDTVLCTSGFSGQRFSTLDLTPDAKLSAPILPSNDHKNFVLGISPDGQRFAFLSVKETERHYFVSDLKPGSTPKKIEPSGEFANMLDALFFLDWR
ncbi:hypothetical protein Athai_13030 [Actinocatenispora thailandica]|uniref:Lipoprotein n=2 Tax=Actinocatenispora thailandica TaxID=227318 RepID=A0A7R7DLM0_9ACTN|nr:hypothetical protein Athai_13030 [Actinocatenispora thailandica]